MKDESETTIDAGWFLAYSSFILHPSEEQRFFRPCFFAFQMACIYQLRFANGIATDRVSN
jgi:hypothetical protein